MLSDATASYLPGIRAARTSVLARRVGCGNCNGFGCNNSCKEDGINDDDNDSISDDDNDDTVKSFGESDNLFEKLFNI